MSAADKSSRSFTVGRRGFMKAGAAVGAAAALQPASVATAQANLQPWWNARPSSAKANRPVAIDLHAHWVPPAYAKAMADLGRPLANTYPLELDIDQRRKWMDEHGVQMHVLTLNGGMPWQLVTPEQGVGLARIVNDAGVAAHMTFPTRFIASIELPIVVGTDSFNARDIEYPSAVVDQFRLPGVDRERILRGNAIRLFKLDERALRPSIT